ncbi:MAG: CpaF family protein [Candidatus Omnitrophica bacterium]|nr:CpaF family protein [Candidatus Omnitrophota bacterium]
MVEDVGLKKKGGGSEYEDIKSIIHRYLIAKTDFLKIKDSLNDDQLRMFVDKAIVRLSQETDLKITFEERAKLVRELTSAIISLGPIRPLMEDKDISEIMINGPRQIYIQKAGRITLTDLAFEDNTHLMHFIQKIIAASGTSRRVDESQPYTDFSLPDGSRVNVIIPPCTLSGPVVTIRKFSHEITTIDHLVELGTMSQQIVLFLIAAVKARLNIVFCGATGSGKTTLLNVLSKHIPEEERIITIEDTSELRLFQEHVVNLQAKAPNIEGKGQVTIRDLFLNSLRMRPDRIIVGEIRSDEVLDLVQSISSGHSGMLAIVHADSPEECFNRMITMMLMSGIRLSGDQIRRQIATSIDLIVYIELYVDGIRRVANVTDLRFDRKTDIVTLQDIFTFKQTRLDEHGKVHGDWVMNHEVPSFQHKFDKRNIKLPPEFFA